MVERCILVETVHLDRPFDRRTWAAEREATAGFPRDGHHAAIDFGGEGAIDPQLRLACQLAPIEGRVIQKRKVHRPLDLEGPLTCKKNDGRVGVDALDGLAAMGRRVGKERKHRLLGLPLIHGITRLRTLQRRGMPRPEKLDLPRDRPYATPLLSLARA